MEKVVFTHPNGEMSELRPVHAIRVAMKLPGLERQGDTIITNSISLREAAIAVRNEYKCRDVRKELRRIAILGTEDESRDISIRCDEPAMLDEMIKASNP